jgi:hypothetical protein
MLAAPPRCRWFTVWCQYSGLAYDAARKTMKVIAQTEPGPRPGPIDNTDFTEAAVRPGGMGSDLDDVELAGIVVVPSTARERHDFWPVSEPSWKLLKEW